MYKTKYTASGTVVHTSIFDKEKTSVADYELQQAVTSKTTNFMLNFN